MKKHSKQCVFVVGMHRSGTSALAGSLGLLGYETSENLLQANEYNSKGFYENLSILAFNEQILEDIGTSWDAVTKNLKESIEIHQLEYINSIKKIVECEFNDRPHIVIKDPRITLFPKIWNRALSELGYKCSFLISYRNPIEVCQSLYYRDGFSYEKSAALIMHYWRHALEITDAFDHYWVNYRDLVNMGIESIGSVPFLKLSEDPEDIQLFNDFITEALKHYSEDPNVIKLAPSIVMDVYHHIDKQDYKSALGLIQSMRGAINSYKDDQYSHSVAECQSLKKKLDETKTISEELQNKHVEEITTLQEANLKQQNKHIEEITTLQEANLKQQNKHIEEIKTIQEANLNLHKKLTEEISQKLALQLQQRSEIEHWESKVVKLEQEVKLLQSENISKVEEIKGLNHTIDERNNRLKLIQQQEKVALKELDNLRQALSTRLGFALTYPIRMVAEYFKRHPTKFNSNQSYIFNLTNLKAFLFALKNEPIRRVLTNTFRRIFSRNKKEKTFPLKEISHNKTSFDLSQNSNILISIILPVYQTPILLLEKCIESVISQTYKTWELIIVDDYSDQANIVHCLLKYSKEYPNIRSYFLEKNVNISEATNFGVQHALGEYIAFLDHDDVLNENALNFVVQRIINFPDSDVIYTDQCKIDELDNLYEPFYKPDWSYFYFLGCMYIGHLLIVRTSITQQIPFRKEYDGVQDFDFMLRVSEITQNIQHIPQVLYYWRAIKGSLALNQFEKENICELQLKSVKEHTSKKSMPITPVNGNFPHRLRLLPSPSPNQQNPLVSIIIPTKDNPYYLEKCLNSIRRLTTYSNYEIIIVDNNSILQETQKLFKEYNVRIVKYNEYFNFSRANNLAVRYCKGEYVILLNNDTEVISENWIQNLLYFCVQDEVGAVGGLLLYSDKSVQHAGVVLGFRGTADHIMRGFPFQSDGYFGSLSCAREVSAVTGACMMTKVSVYNKIGGLDEIYGHIYQDVDYCLKVLTEGLKIVFTPESKLFHHESKSRNAENYDLTDRMLLLDKWGTLIEDGDPYYNLNFDLSKYELGQYGYEIINKK